MKRRWFTTQRTTVENPVVLSLSTVKLFAGTFTKARLPEISILSMLHLLPLLLLAPLPTPILLILVVKLHTSGH